MPRTSMKLAAAALVGGMVVSGCSNLKMGAAATTGNGRISSATLTSQVANLNSAYKADNAKQVKPQRPVAQETQQVLTWLILFRVYDELAAQHGISVTQADLDKQVAGLTGQAAQSKVTLPEYVSSAGALPPDLVPALGRYIAIENALEDKLDGGTAPTSSTGQSALQAQIGHYQCLAAKSLNVKVNPQYGEFDYGTYSVVSAPSTLAADPTPSPSGTPPILNPPC